MKRALFTVFTLLGVAWPPLGMARGAEVTICFNYSCIQQVDVRFDERDLQPLAQRFAAIAGAEEERGAVADAVGYLYRIAGKHTPISNDRAGNLLDAGVHGRMDCIDHSRTTTGFLQLMQARGWLRHHVVAEPARRTRFIFQHYSAVLEARTSDDAAAEEAEGFAIDSWFVEHGEPAVVLPLADWQRGEGPNVH